MSNNEEKSAEQAPNQADLEATLWTANVERILQNVVFRLEALENQKPPLIETRFLTSNSPGHLQKQIKKLESKGFTVLGKIKSDIGTDGNFWSSAVFCCQLYRVKT